MGLTGPVCGANPLPTWTISSEARRRQNLPVQLPTKLELIINLRTATQIDMTMPETLLLLADGLIE
jgi:hypothetical protein